MTQSGSPPAKVVAEFRGSALRWVYAAEDEIKRKNLDLDKYIVSVVEEEESVVVLLRAPDQPKHKRGHAGNLPGLQIEMRKTDASIVRSNYVR